MWLFAFAVRVLGHGICYLVVRSNFKVQFEETYQNYILISNVASESFMSTSSVKRNIVTSKEGFFVV